MDLLLLQTIHQSRSVSRERCWWQRLPGRGRDAAWTLPAAPHSHCSASLISQVFKSTACSPATAHRLDQLNPVCSLWPHHLADAGSGWLHHTLFLIMFLQRSFILFMYYLHFKTMLLFKISPYLKNRDLRLRKVKDYKYDYTE